MPRIGVDATSVSRRRKGHARSQRGSSSRSLRSAATTSSPTSGRRGGGAARRFEPSSIGPGKASRGSRSACGARCAGVDAARHPRRPSAGRRRAPDRRLALRAADAPDRGEPPPRRGAYQRASDLLRRRSGAGASRRAGGVVAGSRATARSSAATSPVVYPAVDAGFGPGPGARAATSSTLRRPTRATTRSRARRVRRGSRRTPTARRRRLGAREAELRALAGERVRFLGRVSDEELVELYRGALAYVDATLYEGFGYQLVEAHGVRRAGGREQPFLDPGGRRRSGPALRPARRRRDRRRASARARRGGLADELRRRGFEQAGRFTWERTAEGFAAVLDDVLA